MRRLPLLLLAFMVGLGLVLESAVYSTLLWQTKVPIALLLALAFVRGGGSAAVRSEEASLRARPGHAGAPKREVRRCNPQVTLVLRDLV